MSIVCSSVKMKLSPVKKKTVAINTYICFLKSAKAENH